MSVQRLFLADAHADSPFRCLSTPPFCCHCTQKNRRIVLYLSFFIQWDFVASDRFTCDPCHGGGCEKGQATFHPWQMIREPRVPLPFVAKMLTSTHCIRLLWKNINLLGFTLIDSYVQSRVACRMLMVWPEPASFLKCQVRFAKKYYQKQVSFAQEPWKSN